MEGNWSNQREPKQGERAMAEVELNPGSFWCEAAVLTTIPPIKNMSEKQNKIKILKCQQLPLTQIVGNSDYVFFFPLQDSFSTHQHLTFAYKAQEMHYWYVDFHQGYCVTREL